MRAFFRRNGVERVVDRWEFPTGSERLGWGLSDKVLMEQTVAEMARLREPFMTDLLSMTNHHPFEVPAEFQRRQNQGLHGRFRDSMAYTEFALG